MNQLLILGGCIFQPDHLMWHLLLTFEFCWPRWWLYSKILSIFPSVTFNCFIVKAFFWMLFPHLLGTCPAQTSPHVFMPQWLFFWSLMTFSSTLDSCSSVVTLAVSLCSYFLCISFKLSCQSKALPWNLSGLTFRGLLIPQSWYLSKMWGFNLLWLHHPQLLP